MINDVKNITPNKGTLLIVITIILIAFNLRAPITAVGSIIDMIQSEYSLSAGVAGSITTLPLIAFAVVSPFVSLFSKRYGYGKVMALGIALIFIGELVRSYTACAGLFIGTGLLGVGIAIGNVLIPTIIKSQFPTKLGVMTSIYVTSMCISAAIGAGISIPLASNLGLGWQNSLAVWASISVVTLAAWMFQVNKKSSSSAPQVQSKGKGSIWRSKTAWWVTLYMGIQSLIFYSLVAWLPTIIIAKGMTPNFAGTVALTYQLLAIPATLTIPMLCARFKRQSMLTIFVSALYIVGVGLLLMATSHFVILCSAVMMSLAMGASISASIAFISLRSPNATRTSELSGMAQSAGYLLAAVGPTLFGTLYDFTGSWTPTISLILVLLVLLGFCGYKAGRDRHTHEE